MQSIFELRQGQIVQKNILCQFFFFFFSSLLDHSFRIKYNRQISVNVIIGIIIKFLLKIVPVQKLSEDYLCSSVKTTTSKLLKKPSHCPSFAICDRQIIFFHVILSHGMKVKQGKVIFFPSHKKFESPYLTDNQWKNTRIKSST